MGFTEHIAKIARKAHQRANLIHRCFTSKNSDLLLKAYITYVRPILEYNSPLWSSSLKKDIILLESVQRRFTKRIPKLATMTYYSRLKKLNLESLELRKLRADLTLVYKILFGVIVCPIAIAYSMGQIIKSVCVCVSVCVSVCPSASTLTVAFLRFSPKLAQT